MNNYWDLHKTIIHSCSKYELLDVIRNTNKTIRIFTMPKKDLYLWMDATKGAHNSFINFIKNIYGYNTEIEECYAYMLYPRPADLNEILTFVYTIDAFEFEFGILTVCETKYILTQTYELQEQQTDIVYPDFEFINLIGNWTYGHLGWNFETKKHLYVADTLTIDSNYNTVGLNIATIDKSTHNALLQYKLKNVNYWKNKQL